MENYYDEIMDADMTDFTGCTNKVALYNKRVKDVKKHLGLVNSLIAQNKEKLEKEQIKLDNWKKRGAQYKEVAKRAKEAGNLADEIEAKREYSKMCSVAPFMDAGVDYCNSQLALLEKAHAKLIKDAEILKSMEDTISNEYTGTPKTVSNQRTEDMEEKKEPQFSVYTNMIID